MKLNLRLLGQFSARLRGVSGLSSRFALLGAARLLLMALFFFSPCHAFADLMEESRDEETEYQGQIISRGGAGLDEAGEIDDGIGAEELSFSSAESRTLFRNFASGGLGLSLPWQVIHGEVGQMAGGGQQATSLFVGMGRFHTGGAAMGDAREASAAVKSTVVGAATKHYLSPKWPLFMRGSLFVAWWDTHLSEPAEPDESFRARTRKQKLLSLGGAVELGGTYFWRNGIYLENTLVGASYATVVSPPSGHIADLARRQIGNIRQWGLFNVALGYMF
jgi:hypothetical protein